MRTSEILEDLLYVQQAGHPVRFEPESNRVTFLSDYTTPDDVFRLRLELPGLQAVTIRSQVPFDRIEGATYIPSMKIQYKFDTRIQAEQYLKGRGWLHRSTAGFYLHDRLPGQTREIVKVKAHWEIKP